MILCIDSGCRVLRAKAYARRRYLLFFISLAVSTVFLLIFQFSGFSLDLAGHCGKIATHFAAALFLYLTAFILIFHLVTIPLSFYQGYIVEHQFGLSNQTLSRWVDDYLKRFLLSYAFFILVIEAWYYLLRTLPDNWWIAAAAFWLLCTVIVRHLFPVLIIPLFYRYRPITDREIRERIFALANKAHMKLFDVCEINLSKDTKKANAALAGLGASKRVLLADTLLEHYSTEEIEVVIAHEFAHHILRHTAKALIFSAILSSLGFFVMQRFLGVIAAALHAEVIFQIDIFPMLYLSFLFLNLLAMPLSNGYSRYLEKRADLFALELTGLRDSFVSCMQRLARDNLADISPGRLIEIFFYNHPPIEKRIAYAQNIS
ncbi:MAG: M48 family metallopeptidase [Candidatus Omnitrophica bacterium]|nr:M48 family metallopeptidase [Candidatus Omnitrophota bacterium]